MDLFRKPVFAAIIVGHFIIDVFNSSGPVLVTYLSIPMALTAAQIGLAIGAYQLFSSLTQPFFGWLADKIGSRWLGSGSVAWTIGFLCLSLVVAQQTSNFYLFLIPFVIAGLGSSAFHPLGTKHAADEAAMRAATGTAIFFLFGQTGLASGPVLSGLILGRVGIEGIYILALTTIPVIIFMVFALRHSYGESISSKTASIVAAEVTQKSVRWGLLAC